MAFIPLETRMKYVIKRLDLNQHPVYLYIADKVYSKPLNVTKIEAATPYLTIKAAIDTIIYVAIHEGQHSLGSVTIVGVKEVDTPRYEEVAL